MNAIKRLSYTETEQWKLKYLFHQTHTQQFLYYYKGFRAYFEQTIPEYAILTKDLPQKAQTSLAALQKIYFKGGEVLKKNSYTKQDVITYLKYGHLFKRPELIRKGLQITRGQQNINNYIRYCLYANIEPIITTL